MWDLIIDKVSINVRGGDDGEQEYRLTMDSGHIWLDLGNEEPRKMPLGQLAEVLRRALYPEEPLRPRLAKIERNARQSPRERRRYRTNLQFC